MTFLQLLRRLREERLFRYFEEDCCGFILAVGPEIDDGDQNRVRLYSFDAQTAEGEVVERLQLLVKLGYKVIL